MLRSVLVLAVAGLIFMVSETAPGCIDCATDSGQCFRYGSDPVRVVASMLAWPLWKQALRSLLARPRGPCALLLRVSLR